MFDSALLTKKIKMETPSFKEDHISQIHALLLQSWATPIRLDEAEK